MTVTSIPTTPLPTNEPAASFAPGTAPRASLQAELKRQAATQADIPLWINGEELRTGNCLDAVMPHDHHHVLATVHQAGAKEIELAIEAALAAQPVWAALSFAERAAIFLRAADLLAGPWRDRINASTMLNQSKTCHQAEIDAACELIDFLRFNVAYAEQLLSEQPESAPGMWNRLDHRPLEGFVFAVTPFNFTSIAVNLPTAPALMGCTVLWKPSRTASYSAGVAMDLLHAAGLPDGVINFVPGSSSDIAPVILDNPNLAGVHFTGSTATFQSIWSHVGKNISRYRSYPRLVGETGGKDFIVAHPSAEPLELATAILRGSFEYQGQKCSAASRIFLPSSLAETVLEQVVADMATLKMGDVQDFGNFLGAVIDKKAFDKHVRAQAEAHDDANYELLAGGTADDRVGYFVEPTLLRSASPTARLMVEELFGPIATVHVFDDSDWDSILGVIDRASPYALTGAVFSRERGAIAQAMSILRNAAGNFYVNDKPTGAVVGQQPFGGGRGSGTNDKAGSYLNLLRWVSPRTIKETFVPARDYRYPFLKI